MRRAEIEKLFDQNPSLRTTPKNMSACLRSFKQALNDGTVRSAEPGPGHAHGWRVNTWVKKGILLGFRMGAIVTCHRSGAAARFFDKATWPVKQLSPGRRHSLVPGGSTIRDGCYIGRGVICMPPMYINAGSWVGDGTMVDSHALVGSCAQVGEELPHLRWLRNWRRAGAGGRDAGHHRGRSRGGRQLRRV